MSRILDGNDLINAGYPPGKHYPEMLRAANKVMSEGGTYADAIMAADKYKPEPIQKLNLYPPGYKPYHVNIEASNEIEQQNIDAVKSAMDHVMRSPVVEAGAIMPDACPTGPKNIPVGGIVSSTGIHPGMHSADICCSMAVSVLKRDENVSKVLDVVNKVSHFGPAPSASRNRNMSDANRLISKFENNKFLTGLERIAQNHFMSQGDGNHFFFVGHSKNTGDLHFVTHHGSRGLGAQLYKRGIAAAERNTKIHCPKIDKQNAWIDRDSWEQDEYWDALQIIREWTKLNHFGIHNKVAQSLGIKIEDQYWNEHNFVFRKSDGLFYHAKGATPAWDDWAHDSRKETIIPLNMAEPILIVNGLNADNGLGFSPHGAGRNMSRTQHKKNNEYRTHKEIFDEETQGIDARFYCGKTDISELPSAYKNAKQVREQIDNFGLAEVVDEILPAGTMMAGDWEQDAPWRKKKNKK